MTPDELESHRAEAFAQVRKSERLRKLQIYGGIAALFTLGMITQYVMIHL